MTDVNDEPATVAEELEIIDVRVDDRVDRVTTVVIDRPEARNAMNAQLRTELKRALGSIERSDARVVVITGSEDSGAFVAGADVQELEERDFLEQRRVSERPRVYEAVDDLRQPVIARINGHAIGGGCELALASDVRIARRDAKLGQAEINLGIMPGGGGTQRLPRLVGEGKAMELILSGKLIDGEEAARIGLVNDAVAPDELDDRVYDLAESMAGKSTVALQMTKKAVKAASRTPLEQGLEYEAELFANLFATGEKNEGIEAFFEDRDPDWQY